MRKLIIVSVAMAAACGPKATTAPIPLLPGDGDAHVVKPPPPKQPAAADPWSSRQDLIGLPQLTAPAPVALPKIEGYKLANGLQVYTLKSDRLPITAIQLAVRAGRMHEPRARLGVAELTANLLVKGTQRRDAAGLAKAIDFVGGTITADATFEATLVSCSVLSRSAGTCLELLPEMILQPTFSDGELTKMRDLLVSSTRQRLEDPGTVASAHAQNLLWGQDHVRGWIATDNSVGSLRRDDVVTWHRTWFVPGNALLVVTGDFEPKKLRADLERAFGGWRKGPTPPTPTYSEQGLSGSRIRLVDRPGQTQTHIRIAQFGIKHDDPRFFDTLIWNHVLGGSSTSRLMRAVRESGKVFGASSSFDRNIDRGSFVASAVAQNTDAVATAKAMLAEIAKMAKDGPAKEELPAAIIGLAGGYGLRFQAATDLASSLASAELHGYGQEYLSNFPVVLAQVDVEAAKRAAAEIINPKAYVMVMVGDAKDLEPALRAEGWRFEKVAFADPISAPFKQPDGPVDPKALAATKKLVEEALAAKGGKAKLSGLKAIKMTAVGTTVVNGVSVPVDIGRTFVLPDKMRIDATLKPAGAPNPVVVSIGVSGKTGWQRGNDPRTNQMAVADIQGAGLDTINFERWREPELILLKASEPSAKLSPAADDVIDGKAYSVVKLQSPFGAVDVFLYIDKKTKLIARMSYSDGGNNENDDYSDYKDVGGLKIAHKRTSSGGGRATTLELKNVELDPAVDPTLFDKPAK